MADGVGHLPVVAMLNLTFEFLIRPANLKSLIQMAVTFEHIAELAHLSNKEIHQPPKTLNYPEPIVDYKKNRQRALNMYSVVKSVKI